MSSDGFVAGAMNSRQVVVVGRLVEGGASEGDVEKVVVLSEFPESAGDVVVKVVPAKAELVGRPHGQWTGG